MKKTILQIVLLAIAVFLAYMIYESIMRPVRFNKERDLRTTEVIQNLKDIRGAQIAYRSIYQKYTKSFDTLIHFINTGKIPVVKMVPDPTDTTFTRSIRDTIGYILVKDSLFAKRQGFDVNNLRYIPYSNRETFTMDAGQIERSKIMVNVFEAYAMNSQFLKGLDNQLVSNYNDLLESTQRFPGLKVGSMEEATIDGNWE
ncbi:MAG: hypothetical protein PHD61_10845 [Bacteroidales bacterium]|nr:hypothetical protein [Lentimicrobiaceae bacterium]MDD5695784.1 hypothetical protein [Bacteroidales bacterium]